MTYWIVKNLNIFKYQTQLLIKCFHTSSQYQFVGNSNSNKGKYSKFNYDFPPGKPNDKPKDEHFYFIRENLLAHVGNLNYQKLSI
jgi:hypothetical protein